MKMWAYMVAAVAASVSGQLSPIDLGGLPDKAENSTIAATPTTAGVLENTSWQMPYGNLVANWSFENEDQFWIEGERLAVSDAPTGKYVNRLSASGQRSLISGKIRIKAQQRYRLTFLYKGNFVSGGITAKISPKVTVSRLDQPQVELTSVVGPFYANVSNWSVYALTFESPNDGWAQISFGNGTFSGQMALAIDNVLLVEDGVSVVNQSTVVSDPMGIEYHSMSLAQGEGSYLVSAVGYDQFHRPESTFLPFRSASVPLRSRISDPYSMASNYYLSYAGSATPFSKVKYSGPTVELAMPGDPYKIETGKTNLSGYAYVKTLPIGESQLYPDLQSPPQESGEGRFLYKWSRGPDGNYELAWIDQLGRLTQTAKQLGASGANKWAFQFYEYYPDGKIKTVVTPMNYAEYHATGAVPENGLSSKTSYDRFGRVIAVNSPDQGLVRYWYNKAGSLRFQQSASQRSKNTYTYFRYDVFGRLISEGELVNSSLTNSHVEDTAYPNLSATYTGSDKPVERKGWIYDEFTTTTWNARVPNVPYATVLGTTLASANHFVGKNGIGRLVAKYNRNPDYSGGDLDEAGRLVVDLFGYDLLGRAYVSGKYLGAVTDASDRRQSQEYRYDSAGRVAALIVDKSIDQSLSNDGSRQTDQWYQYSYDSRGRVLGIRNGRDATSPVASYYYNDLGQLSKVRLGAAFSLTADFKYNLRSQLEEISATAASGKIYVEKLSYETAGTLGGVETPDAKYDGSITRTMEQVTGQNIWHQPPSRVAGTEPLKVTNFSYDLAGRQSAHATFVNRENVTFDGFGNGTASNFDLVPQLSRSWKLDPNNRIYSVTEPGSTPKIATYSYKDGTNQLQSVTGCINPACDRDASSSTNFTYDADGQMVADASAKRCHVYDASGVVVKMGVGTANCSGVGAFNFFLYDADGLMVAAVTRNQEAGVAKTSAKHFYVRLGGVAHKEILESWNPTTNTRTSSTKIINLMGKSGTIGRRLATGEQQFYIKNHLGSVVQLVKEDGSVAATFDYAAMGDLRTLRGDDPRVTSKFTGKEFFEGAGLYYFGARWFDPQLGMWISPDPANQFMSPYAYGPDFINGVDPNGMWWGGDLYDWVSDGLDDAGSWTSSAAGDAWSWTSSTASDVGSSVQDFLDWICQPECRAKAQIDCGKEGCENGRGEVNITDRAGNSTSTQIGGTNQQKKNENMEKAGIRNLEGSIANYALQINSRYSGSVMYMGPRPPYYDQATYQLYMIAKGLEAADALIKENGYPERLAGNGATVFFGVGGAGYAPVFGGGLESGIWLSTKPFDAGVYLTPSSGVGIGEKQALYRGLYLTGGGLKGDVNDFRGWMTTPIIGLPIGSFSTLIPGRLQDWKVGNGNPTPMPIGGAVSFPGGSGGVAIPSGYTYTVGWREIFDTFRRMPLGAGLVHINL